MIGIITLTVYREVMHLAADTFLSQPAHQRGAAHPERPKVYLDRIKVPCRQTGSLSCDGAQEGRMRGQEFVIRRCETRRRVVKLSSLASCDRPSAH